MTRTHMPARIAAVMLALLLSGAPRAWAQAVRVAPVPGAQAAGIVGAAGVSAVRPMDLSLGAPALTPGLPKTSSLVSPGLLTPKVSPTLTASPSLAAPASLIPAARSPLSLPAAALPVRSAADHRRRHPRKDGRTRRQAERGRGQPLTEGLRKLEENASKRGGSRTLGKSYDNSQQRSGRTAPAVSAEGSVQGRTPGLRPAVRDLLSIQELKVGTYNIFNLFRSVGQHEGKQKAEWRVRGTARAILDSDLDVVVLQEVEDRAALERYNEEYLHGSYRTVMLGTNDPRGLSIAFLVKKDIPFEIETRSFTGERRRDRGHKVFTRDLPALVFRAPGESKPLFVLFGVHLKARKDRVSDYIRKAEAERAVEILSRFRDEFGEDVPVLMAGDFNWDPKTDPSLKGLVRDAGLTDAFDSMKTPPSELDRVTHSYHKSKNSQAEYKQIDAVLVSEGLKLLVKKAEVYRYRYNKGGVKPLPKTRTERNKNPSDHFPVLVRLSFQPLVRRVLEGEHPEGSAAQDEARSVMEKVMKTQGIVFSVLAESSGLDTVVLSMAMNAFKDGGLTMQDYVELHDRLAARDVTGEELIEALRDELKNTPFGKKIDLDDESQRPAPEDWIMLSYRIKELHRAVEILRNGRYFGWKRRFLGGERRAGKISFKHADARIVDGDVQVTLGSCRDQGVTRPVVFTMSGKMSTPEDAAGHFDELFRSKRLSKTQTRDLLRLTRKLEILGLLRPGYTEKARRSVRS